jgi:transposase-like protein
MPKKRSRVFSRSFKLAAVRRMMAGEDVSALSRELRVLRKDLYYWRTRFRAGGAEALRGKGRPKKTEVEWPHPNEPLGEVEKARERIAELERKIGQQQVDLDFFRQALQRAAEVRRPSAKPGAPRSTRSSKR